MLVLVSLEVSIGPADRRARHGADLTEITVESDAVGQDLPVEVVVPEAADSGDPRPLLVFLHGRGKGGEESNLNGEMYEALSDQGEKAPIVAFPSGGDHSYWHDRAGGDWGEYVLKEVIPQVSEDFNVDRRRIAIGGISMGGFGALDLARLNPDRFCAVGGHSPALWQTGALTAPGAFDDAGDFAAHDVVASAGDDSWLSQPIWIDAGDADPFRPGIDEFAAKVGASGAPLNFHIWPGEHEGNYWRSHWDAYMRFYARALEKCG